VPVHCFPANDFFAAAGPRLIANGGVSILGVVDVTWAESILELCDGCSGGIAPPCEGQRLFEIQNAHKHEGARDVEEQDEDVGPLHSRHAHPRDVKKPVDDAHLCEPKPRRRELGVAVNVNGPDKMVAVIGVGYEMEDGTRQQQPATGVSICAVLQGVDRLRNINIRYVCGGRVVVCSQYHVANGIRNQPESRKIEEDAEENENALRQIKGVVFAWPDGTLHVRAPLVGIPYSRPPSFKSLIKCFGGRHVRGRFYHKIRPAKQPIEFVGINTRQPASSRFNARRITHVGFRGLLVGRFH
jgi:hypothetical protein